MLGTRNLKAGSKTKRTGRSKRTECAERTVLAKKAITKKRRSSERTPAVNEQLFRRIFIVFLVGMVATVILGFGPVWLSAEATRASQHSQALKVEIADTLAESESLEMQRATIGNNLRLNQNLMQEVGMARCEGERSYIELNDSELVPGTSFSLTSDARLNNDSVVHLANLTLLTAGSGDDNEAQSAENVVQGINFAEMARNSLDTIASLTAGEASTLLVGDVGLAGLR